MDVSLSFAGETLVPLPCGGLHWPAQQALLVADLHFEKASAYAPRGRLLPPYDSHSTLTALIDSIEATGARRVICLGDSFHDAAGPSRLADAPRQTLRMLTRDLDWLWIAGNHDDEAAGTLGGRVAPELRLGPLTLRHEAVPGDPAPELSGHFHPKITIRIRGRAITRRCFALTATKIILPAYGALTGGLAVDDPAYAPVFAGPATALVCEARQLLRFPVPAAIARNRTESAALRL
jgi:DNA ligase-associated metallophosphoesterase